MSRSFKKHPVYTDGRGGRKPWKRIANKAVRNYKSYLKKNGKDYKKLYCSWNIHDFAIRYTWEEYKAWYIRDIGPLEDDSEELKKLYRDWRKYHYNK